MRSLLLTVILMVAPTASKAGGPLDVLEAELKPLNYTNMGRIEMCGVHFSTATTGEGRYFAVQGSANVAFYKDRLPTMIFKLAVVEATNGQAVRRPVAFALMRHQDQSTAEFWHSTGEDGFSWLAVANTPELALPSVDLAQRVFEAPWISFNLGDGGRDFSFQLPDAKNAESVMREFLDCQQQGLAQYKL